MTVKTIQKVCIDDAHLKDEVIADLKRRVELEPGNGQLRNDLGAWLLSYGNLKEGWPHLVGRFGCHNCGGDYDFFPVPMWDGEDIRGKKVLYWLEQGVGDQIFQSSMVPDLAALADVTMYVSRRMYSIFKRSFPQVRIRKPGQLTDFDFDYQLTYSDVGQIVRGGMENWPYRPKLLQAQKTEETRAKYQALFPGKKLIGLSWRSGNPMLGPGKSIPIEFLDDHLREPVAFISLQYDETPDELKETRLYRDPEVNQLWDMESFLSQVDALDGVVSISNTALHVAGALGKDTIGLLPRGNCRNWFWFTGKDRSVVYPTVELVRCHADLDWLDPMNRSLAWIRERI